MEVVVVGAHGQIARLLTRQLTENGHQVRGVIRNPDHAADVEADGATPVVFDLERDSGLAQHIAGADAAVFAAGAGPGSGPERKRTVDLGGAITLIDACREAGVERYVIVSSINADRPDNWNGPMKAYFEAKHDADEALRASGLAYTIVRPGRLTDDEPTGLITVGNPNTDYGEIPRADVAATLAAVLERPGTAGTTFDLISGDVPIADAVASLDR